MLPVLLNIGPVTISSLGLFLVLAFLLGTFLIWRLARAWEVNNEVLLDAVFFTTIFAFIGARAYFVLVNFEFFSQNILGIFNIFRLPGFSFWGGFFLGLIGLFICTTYPNLARRLSLGVLFSSAGSKKLNFYQVADIGVIGFLGGLVLGDVGCLLGGCDVGVISNNFLAVNLVGVVSERFPVQLLEAILLFIVLLRIWPEATKFHFHGKIVSKTLIYIGLIKFFMQFLRDPQSDFYKSSYVGFGFSAALIIFGTFLYYHSGKGSLSKDINTFFTNLIGFFTNREIRSRVVERSKKSWYNRKVGFSWKLRQLKKLLRRARVKPTPENV
jgi:phosphatidylglycerol---prolipoprotein diacylglyceryl transferase